MGEHIVWDFGMIEVATGWKFMIKAVLNGGITYGVRRED